MNRALINKCLGDAKWLWLVCGLGAFAYAWLFVWFVSRLEMTAFAGVIEQLWDKIGKFSPVPLEQLLTYSGRIARAFSEPIIVLCLSVWAVSRGSDVVSGELGRGTMEMLLSQPITRLQLIVTQGTVTVLGAALLAVGVWCGVASGIATTQIKEKVQPQITVPGLGFRVPNPLAPAEEVRVPMREKTRAEHFTTAAVNLFCLTTCLAGIATWLSSWDRYRWRTIGIMVAFYVIQTTLRTASLAIEELAWMQYLSLFTAFEPEVCVSLAVNQPELSWAVWTPQGIGPMGRNLVLLGIGGGAYLIAAIQFARRDLPAPL